MLIQQLKIDGLRNLCQQTLNLDVSKRVNLFIGDNGAGKTTILEAIHCLAAGSSFRSTPIKQLIAQTEEKYTLFAPCEDAQSGQVLMGTSKMRDSKVEARLNGEKIKSQQTVSALLPVMVLEPGSFDLVLGSPDYRRRFIDWGVFHVKHEYWSIAARYKKVIKQRNALLRTNASKELIHPWTNQLIDLAEQVSNYRSNYFDELKIVFEDIVSQLTDLEKIEIRYNKGWSKDLSYADYLSANPDGAEMLCNFEILVDVCVQ